MNFFELFLLAAGLAMDAFAVSVCKGLATERLEFKHTALCGIWFGGFQALMPLIGYFFGSSFEKYIKNFDHWIAFILLGIIGANMIKESFSQCIQCTDASFSAKAMFVMAIATSIDALAVGISLAVLPNVNIYLAIVSIGFITFVLSWVGVKVGNIFGSKYKNKAQLMGGIILIAIGIKILLEHLDVIK